MNDNTLMEVLAAYADDLNNGRADRETCLRQFSGRHEELKTLLHLAEQVKQVLVPVEPSPTFVQKLLRQLVVADGQEQARSYRREVVIGAAAVGSVLSVIGIVAYLLRNRTEMKVQATSAG